MSEQRVFVSEEIVTVWEFTIERFVETYREEWERDGKPDPKEWLRQSIEELGPDQLERVAPGEIDDRDLQVAFK